MACRAIKPRYHGLNHGYAELVVHSTIVDTSEVFEIDVVAQPPDLWDVAIVVATRGHAFLIIFVSITSSEIAEGLWQTNLSSMKQFNFKPSTREDGAVVGLVADLREFSYEFLQIIVVFGKFTEHIRDI